MPPLQGFFDSMSGILFIPFSGSQITQNAFSSLRKRKDARHWADKASPGGAYQPELFFLG